MPHKHKRRRANEDASFDLPPNSITKPLPAFHQTPRDDEPYRKAGKYKSRKNGVKARKVDDDTPRAFARLLNFQRTGKRLPPTLDDGSAQKGKKRKRETDDPANTMSKAKHVPTAIPETATNNPPDIKILAGERLAEFSARVDQALPIAGMRTKGQTGTIKIPGVKAEERKTKHNRRLERMQKEWREGAARRKEKIEEEMENEEEERERQQLLWGGIKPGGKKKKQRQGDAGGSGEDEDPWAELEERRRGSKQKNLQDVVQAPPQLKGVKSKFKDLGLAGVDVRNVPGSVGSLRKREELGLARRRVINEYRKMMARKDQAIRV